MFGKVKYLILFGECKNLLSKKINSVENIIIAEDLKDAVSKAKYLSRHFPDRVLKII